MRKVISSLIVLLVLVLLSYAPASAASNQLEESQKRKCSDMIKESTEGDSNLYSAILQCELNVDESFEAVGGDLSFGSNLGNIPTVTGKDLVRFGNPPPSPKGPLPPIPGRKI